MAPLSVIPLALLLSPQLTCLDFVLDYARHGEMKSLLNKLGSLSLPCSRYYAAQLVDTIDYMHSKGVIHRYASPYPRSFRFLTLSAAISSLRIFCSTIATI